jgi:hypothetical protein
MHREDGCIVHIHTSISPSLPLSLPPRGVAEMRENEVSWTSRHQPRGARSLKNSISIQLPPLLWMRISLHRPENGQLQNKSRHDRWACCFHLVVEWSWTPRWPSRPLICMHCRRDKLQVRASSIKTQRSRHSSTYCLAIYITEDLPRIIR